jgi:hypothetical protein
MEEASEKPPYIILPNEYFTVFENGRQKLLSGQQPTPLGGQRGIRARAWRIYQNQMAQTPPWERAERYRRLMEEKGCRSVRALARATGEDHSRIARILKVLDLPAGVLAALREHSDNARVRAHFTEKRLRQLARKKRAVKGILHTLQEVLHADA